MNCIVVDDDATSRKAMEHLISKVDWLQLIESCSSAFEASKIMAEERIDLIFLDMEMPEITGLEFLDGLNSQPYIIVVSSEEKYAVKAFEADANDYLVKPVADQRFLKAVNRVREKMQAKKEEPTEESPFIFVKSSYAFVKLQLEDILWIESLGDYVTLHTSGKKYVINITMKKVEAKLPERLFCRIHRSYIINLNRVDRVEEGIVVIGDKHFPISRSYKNNLMEHMNLL